MKTLRSLCRKVVCLLGCLLACLCANCALVPSVKAADSDSTSTSRRAVKFLIDQGEHWIKKRGCVSCHQVPAMLWSLHALHQDGDWGVEKIADQDLNRWTAWSVDPVNFVKPEQKKDLDVDATLAANIDTMAAMLLAIPGAESPEDSNSGVPGDPWRKQFVRALCREQQEDGSWKACGQLPMQKRPKRETSAATTLWVMLALSRSGCEDFDFAAALKFADGGKPAVSTEWYAVRALVELQQGAEAVVSHRQRLLEHQNKDGGWGWIAGQESDALATGIALYSLSALYDNPSSAEPANDAHLESLVSAREYLTRTQTENGSWKVPGTKTSAKGRATPTANYWGTAWAVVGLRSTATMMRAEEPSK